jgi:thiol:disulfide interchange protein DsbD
VPLRRISRLVIGCALASFFLFSAPVSSPAASPAPEAEEDLLKILQIKIVLSQNGAPPGGELYAAIFADIRKDFHINSNRPTLDMLIPTEVIPEPAPGVEFGQVVYPPPDMMKLEFAEEKLAVYQRKVRFIVPIRLGKDVTGGKITLKTKFSYQACDTRECFPPVEETLKFDVPVLPGESAVRLANQESFEGFSLSEGKLLGSAGAGGPGGFGERFESKGLILTYLVVFVVGLSLCGTPCIYPVIPITVSFFVKQAGGGTGKLLRLSGLYLLGLVMMYSVLGAVAGVTGKQLGFALQSPVVLIGIALVLIVLATSMFGLWEIRLPMFLSRVGSSQGYLGAVVMGLTVGIFTAPCIGPFVLGLLIWVGTTGSPLIGFSVFFVLALGMGIPIVILGFVSGSIPRSGGWMEWVERFFGVVLVFMALYFVRPLVPEPLLPWIVLLLSVAAALYLGLIVKAGREGRFRYVRAGLSVLIFLAGVTFVLLPERGWPPYTKAAMEKALKEGKPVIIDFRADWCIPCIELEKRTFSQPQVREALKRFAVFKADVTLGGSEDVKALQKEYRVQGVPTVIFIGPDGKEIPDLRLLQFDRPEAFLDRLRKVPS